MTHIEKISEEFTNLCSTGKYPELCEFVKNNFDKNKTNPTYIKISDKEKIINLGLYEACKNNHTDIINEILTNPNTKKEADIYRDYSACLRVACRYEHFETVDLLTKHKEALKEILLKPGNNHVIFFDAASTEYSKHYAIPLVIAATYGYDEIVNYFLSNDKIFDALTSKTLMMAFKESLDTGNVDRTSMLMRALLIKDDGYEKLDNWAGFNKSTWALHNTILNALSNNNKEMVIYLMDTFYYKFDKKFLHEIAIKDKDLTLEIKNISENLSLYKSLSNNMGMKDKINKCVKV